MKHEILLGLTTTPASDWRGKVEEMKQFGIKRIALFPTFLKIEQRKELYTLLEDIEGLVIPHVHLREQDMEPWELEWFERHGTEAYNIHMHSHHYEVIKKFIRKVFVENNPFHKTPEGDLQKTAGMCIDFQHWAWADRLHPIVAANTRAHAEAFKVGCCHISPLPKLKNTLLRIIKRVGNHYMISLDELDYIGQYTQYLPKYISLEMENTFQRQLEAKAYLESIINLKQF